MNAGPLASAAAGSAAAAGRLEEAARLSWREDASERTVRRDERRWTAWTVWIALAFTTPGALLVAIEPLTLPVAALCFAHAWAIPWIQARRGARQVVPIGSERGAARRAGADGEAEGVALGLLGDLVGHAERELLSSTGLAMQPGALGVWLVGEQGALLVRRRGRVACWCVRVGETGDLPAGDRVAHLLLALREDELGFAKVANLGFSGALWRVRPHLPERSRPALASARRAMAGS